MLKKLLLLVVLASFALPVFAVEPSEMLDDPVLEARAREVSKGLRCLVCQNENIDDSNAKLAHDLRVLVRDRIVAGDTNEQAEAYIVDRYGEFVLLKPPFNFRNAFLWFTGPVLLLLGGWAALVFIRRRAQAGKPVEGLSEEEQQRLAALLKE